MQGRSIKTAVAPLSASFRAPGSKSVTHRALVVAALATGRSSILSPLDADDTRVTLEGLRELGFGVAAERERWTVTGLGGRVPGGGRIELGDSGTSFRLLTALSCLGHRPSRLDGSARLRERPIGDLTRALAELGADVRPTPGGGGLPLVAGGPLTGGGRVTVAGGRSSQFASALLALGARLPRGLDLVMSPPAVSLPYVELTAKVLRGFDVPVRRVDSLHWTVAPGDYSGREYTVEGDHSSASYFLAAAALVGGRVRVEGVDPESPQPDGRLSAMLERMGCGVRSGDDWIEVEGTGRIPAFDFDLRDSPDIVPTLAVLAMFAEGPCRMSGVGHLRLKESDRLEVLARNLTRMGRGASVVEDGLHVEAPSDAPLRAATVETASDHRMAMAFAVAGLRLAGVVVDDADCVSKSNPSFWRSFERLERQNR